MINITKSADAKKFTRILLATLLFIGLLSLEARATIVADKIISFFSYT